MTELRIIPHLRRPATGSAGRKGAGVKPKHSVWDARSAKLDAAGGREASPWSARYATKLRISDTLVVAVVVAVAYLSRFGVVGIHEPADLKETGYMWVCMAIVVLWLTDLAYCRSREKSVFGAGVTEYRRVTQATLRSFGLMAMALLVFQIEVSRGFFAVALPLGIVLLVAERWLWRGWLARQRDTGKSLSNVVVIGNPQDVEYVIGQLGGNLSTGYRVAGAALTTLAPGMSLLPPWYHVPVLSTAADIAEVVAKTGAEAVIVAGALPGGPKAIQELGWRLEDMNTELVLASSLTNVAGPRVHFRPLEGLPLMRVELPQYSGGKHVFKRVMDMLLATAALLVLTPLFLVLALVVKLDSPGPVLFLQERIGRNGETFKMVKFRSMVVGAEAKLAALQDGNEGAGVLFKMANDPRVTRSGRWMRRFSMDELPQFWNVVKGHMSLVGPRPPLATEVAEYQQPVQRRLLIKPGITGLWQISGRSDLAWDEAVRLDLYYVENWSLTGDLVILWRTFKAVVAPTGAY
ncbi:exopolysaccharide biosynthesis polyprenyl glycosylphosphotransferase [Arthrobacter stackebrandtii]|uniref:Exopolysaccharide biosynthesis polyprenyl glycosylphosphotransferase n=1 Tax=Arthrobacter stackebrandtii TaxID=272161 RepID=A0ABS4YRZ3_9MICC|nr:sugar transferase [Arthrobacter stackebrandtii]MBP2411562.1 exopolysaccharide biosynthesis polyprenyl glycosylphosphotransferase [Arthrobacter stackebrandtii]PYG99241.1 polyprenyl glycosylphosphotransferase [Arthrobacter stackebrandtii]